MNRFNQHDMEESAWTRISLCLFSDDVSLDEMAEVMDEEDYYGHSTGDLLSPRSPQGPLRKENHWSIMFDTDVTLPFEKHLEVALEFVHRKSEELIQLQDRCNMHLFCSSKVLHRCAFNLKLDDMALLNRTGVWLCFDLTAKDVA